MIYDHAGRTTAYAVSAALMVTFVAVGAWLARPAWKLRGNVDDSAETAGAEVPGIPVAVHLD